MTFQAASTPASARGGKGGEYHRRRQGGGGQTATRRSGSPRSKAKPAAGKIRKAAWYLDKDAPASKAAEAWSQRASRFSTPRTQA